MKLVIMVLLFLSAYFFLTIAQDSNNNEPDFKFMQEINNAWSTLDPNNAAKYYDMSPDNIYFDIAPFRYKGWRSYSEGAKEFFSTLSSMTYTVGEDASVRTKGNFAFGSSTLSLVTIDKNQKKDSLDLRWTVIWEKKETGWLIIHEHLSIPAKAP